MQLKEIANLQAETIAERFSKMRMKDIRATFDRVNNAVPDTETSEFEVMKALNNFLSAITLLRYQYQDKRVDDIVRYISDSAGHMAQTSLTEIITEAGFNAEFAEIYSKNIVRADGNEEDAMLMSIFDIATQMITDNPEHYRYPLLDLPIEIQNHLDNMETIIKTLLQRDASFDIFKVSAMHVIETITDTTDDVPKDIRQIEPIVLFRLSSRDEIMFQYHLPYTCTQEGAHYAEDHIAGINKGFMQHIAQYL